MTDTKFTPGPWMWRQSTDMSFGDDKKTWCLAPGILIADMTDGTPGGDKRDRANAHLIAAAPDLYEALSSVGDNLLSGDDSAHGGYVDLDGAAVQKIMDALAKARGEAS
jgi:hypothetical protein